MVGIKLGTLRVIERVKTPEGKSGRRGPYYRCECECGNTQYVATSGDLRSGRIKSCGCWRRSEAKAAITQTHGMTRSREWNAWVEMRKRCNDLSNPHYGGRGISYDPAWEDFKTFFTDLGPCPESYSLDRIDTEKGYFKENCKWSTHKDQCNNRLRNGRQSPEAGLQKYRERRAIDE